MADQLEPDLADAEIEAIFGELTTDDYARHVPPADVWSGIESELAAGAAATPVADGDRIRLVDDTAGPADTTGANVVTLSAWRTRSRLLVAAAAAAAVVVAGIVAVTAGGDADTEVVASADLVWFADDPAFDDLGADASAHVNLVVADEAFAIEIDESDLPVDVGEPADLEIWLLQPADDELEIISLGVVDPSGPGTYEVPGEIDVTDATLVDISVEPRDGDASHSGRSLLRAPLDFA